MIHTLEEEEATETKQIHASSENLSVWTFFQQGCGLLNVQYFFVTQCKYQKPRTFFFINHSLDLLKETNSAISSGTVEIYLINNPHICGQFPENCFGHGGSANIPCLKT